MMLPEYAEKYKAYLLAVEKLIEDYRMKEEEWSTKREALEDLAGKIRWPKLFEVYDNDQGLAHDLSLILDYVDLEALQKEAETRAAEHSEPREKQ